MRPDVRIGSGARHSPFARATAGVQAARVRRACRASQETLRVWPFRVPETRRAGEGPRPAEDKSVSPPGSVWSKPQTPRAGRRLAPEPAKVPRHCLVAARRRGRGVRRDPGVPRRPHLGRTDPSLGADSARENNPSCPGLTPQVGACPTCGTRSNSAELGQARVPLHPDQGRSASRIGIAGTSPAMTKIRSRTWPSAARWSRETGR